MVDEEDEAEDADVEVDEEDMQQVALYQVKGGRKGGRKGKKQTV